MVWRIVYTTLHGLFFAYGVWWMRRLLATGRAPIWNGFVKTYYAERATMPVVFWCVVAAFVVIDLFALSFVVNDLVGGTLYH